MLTRQASIQYLCFLNSGNYQPNFLEVHAAEIGGGVIANARAQAGAGGSISFQTLNVDLVWLFCDQNGCCFDVVCAWSNIG